MTTGPPLPFPSLRSLFVRRVAFPFLLILALSPFAPAHADPSADSYADELVRRVAELRLWEQRYWHVLLHYRADWLGGGFTSEADEPGFFLAPTGKSDPQAELEATIRRMFSPDLVGRSKQPAQCAFVARYHWLKEQLAIDDRRLPPESCPRFKAWLEALEPQGVSLIFPSAYLNNPSSMFGHIFLRIDQKGQTDQTRILAYTINYAAEIGSEGAILYPIRGIFGGFKGYFSTIPYYIKVQEYRDFENRDIWEYQLDFDETRLRRLLMHAWELGNASFDYFFFKENCAYHILSLLEAGNPALRLTDQFLAWTVPADTVRVIVAQGAIRGAPVYRPARSTKIKQQTARLSTEEFTFLRRITKDAATMESPEFRRLAPERQAFVLDVASDYLLYRVVTDVDHAAEYTARNRDVLATRSTLRIKSEDVPILAMTSPPEEGHKTSRAGLAAGWRNGTFFEELTLRAGYHDLLDPDRGYTSGAQIELMSAAVRHYDRINLTRLERLTLANVISLTPMDSLFQSPSWKVSGGLQTVRPTKTDAGCRFCSNLNFNAGAGGALERRWVGNLLMFAFAEVDANYGPAYDENHRVGGGGTLGLLATLTERWKILASTTYLRYPLGDKSEDWRATVQQRYTIQRNLAIRLELNHRYRDDEALLTLQAYF